IRWAPVSHHLAQGGYTMQSKKMRKEPWLGISVFLLLAFVVGCGLYAGFQSGGPAFRAGGPGPFPAPTPPPPATPSPPPPPLHRRQLPHRLQRQLRLPGTKAARQVFGSRISTSIPG